MQYSIYIYMLNKTSVYYICVQIGVFLGNPTLRKSTLRNLAVFCIADLLQLPSSFSWLKGRFRNSFQNHELLTVICFLWSTWLFFPLKKWYSVKAIGLQQILKMNSFPVLRWPSNEWKYWNLNHLPFFISYLFPQK